MKDEEDNRISVDEDDDDEDDEKRSIAPIVLMSRLPCAICFIWLSTIHQVYGTDTNHTMTMMFLIMLLVSIMLLVLNL